MSGASGRWATRCTNSGRVRPERDQGVDALDVAVVEPVPPVVAQRDRAVVVRHDDEADTGVRGQAVDEAGEARVRAAARSSRCFSPRT